MLKSKRAPKKVTSPDYVGRESACILCGGTYSVTERTAVTVATVDGKECATVVCPHCGKVNPLDSDPTQVFRAKLTNFILAQVAPIKAIEDEAIRLPMQKLLDDIYAIVQEG